MSVSLTKGSKVSLEKMAPGLSRFTVGLGWDVNKYDGGQDFDLDASAFMTGADGKVLNEDGFIFYGHDKDAAGSVLYGGDNRTGAGDGDDETINVDLSKVPANIDKITFTVTIYDAEARGQCFGSVENSYIRFVNPDTNEELFKFEMGEELSSETAVVAGEIYKHGSEWKFNPVGQGFNGGLAALCQNFGIDAS